MTRSTNLAERIARLERLLDGLEESRLRSLPASVRGDAPVATDRLRDVTAILRDRLNERDLDDGDAIAMRALLGQFRSMMTDLRAHTTELDQRLSDMAMRIGDGYARLEALEDI